MKLAFGLVVAVAVLGGTSAADAQQNQPQNVAPAAQPANAVAQAYEQFLLARRLAAEDDVDGAVAAYKRAISLDPKSAAIVVELADLYMNRNRVSDAIAAAEQALKVSPTNLDAHRVLGVVYGSMGISDTTRVGLEARQENLAKGIQHLEKAIDRPVGHLPANVEVRAMLARLYVANGQPDLAIPLLIEHVTQEPTWQRGAALLARAYGAAGRGEEAIRWLEEAAPDNPRLYRTLAGFYSEARRWKEAAGAYEKALGVLPNSFTVNFRYGSMLLSRGSDSDLTKARDVLRKAVSIRGTDWRALYLLSQAERRSGDLAAAERIARRLIAQNRRNPRGYIVLAEALEERRGYQEVIDALAAAVSAFRSGADTENALSLLLPHLGFAYQQVGKFDEAIASFEEALKLSPANPTIAAYLIQAALAAKRQTAALRLAHAARAEHPGNLELAQLEAYALRQSGKPDQGIALLEEFLTRRAEDPSAHIALAQAYSGANRRAQAVKVLQEARARFPSETSITFELGAVLEKQKKFGDAEAVFRQVIAQDGDHAPALNYLGYMLADRGERLNESVDLIKRALQVEPNNGAYLDSLGWAYYKVGKLDLAEEHLKRAADQLVTNSVVQDHYGDVLFSLGRFDAAIAAWSRALTGDGEDVDRGDIDRKIRSARQKLAKR